VLEELFKDQLEFRIQSVLDLFDFSKKHHKEVFKLIDELQKCTLENLKLLEKK
jgi:hypothetical protein